MKFMKKAMAMVLSLAMLMAMCVSAFAANITAPSGAHSYEIYQIFTGTTGGDKLTDIKWGQNGQYIVRDEETDTDKDTASAGAAVPDEVLNALNGLEGKTDTAKLAVIKQYANLESAAFATVSAGSSRDVVPGYYLVKDTNTESDKITYIAMVVKGSDIAIDPKSDNAPKFEKKLKDTNDTTGVTSEWQDSADYDIGDAVPFKLEGTVASNYDSYSKYYYAFHDMEEAGLTFNEDSVKVSYVDADGTSHPITNEDKTYYKVVTNPTDGCTFEVVFDDLKQVSGVTATSKIRVEYTATLNDKAVLGNEGNVNKGKLEYSNNPKFNGEGKPGTDETPWDNVIVFTYKVVVNKVDGNKQPLTGAEFTLQKKLKDGTTKDIAVVKSENGTSFTFKGLDDGDYILHESKTPEGYNSIADIEFTVKADHTIEWNGENRTGVLTSLTGNTTTGNIAFSTSDDKGTLTTNVVNKSGTTLPGTGGMGTTIFYVIGGMLMAAALVLFTTKKRMEANK